MRHDITPFRTSRPALREFAGASPFGALQAQMNRLFDDMWRDFGALGTQGDAAALAAPSVDVSEDDRAVQVTAEMPGLSEKDLEVEFANGTLRIAGEKTRETNGGDRRDMVTERVYGRFERLIPIAREVDADNVDAQYRDGVLTVTLPKLEQGAGRHRIEVKRAA